MSEQKLLEFPETCPTVVKEILLTAVEHYSRNVMVKEIGSDDDFSWNPRTKWEYDAKKVNVGVVTNDHECTTLGQIYYKERMGSLEAEESPERVDQWKITKIEFFRSEVKRYVFT